MKPALHRPQRAQPLWREPHDAPTFATCARSPGVLVAEDDPVQALLITLMLEHLGVSCTLVTDGLQAVEAVREASYALVLMDYRMPGLDGVEATRRIRQWEAETGRAPVPIAAVTASAMNNECQRYTEAGMDDVVLKPFSAETLCALLARHGCARPGASAPLFVRHGVTS